MEFHCALHGKPHCEFEEKCRRPENQISPNLTPEELEFYEETYDYKCKKVRTLIEEKFTGWLEEYPCPLALKLDETTGELLELPIFVDKIKTYFTWQQNMKPKKPKPPEYFGIDP